MHRRSVCGLWHCQAAFHSLRAAWGCPIWFQISGLAVKCCSQPARTKSIPYLKLLCSFLVWAWVAARPLVLDFSWVALFLVHLAVRRCGTRYDTFGERAVFCPVEMARLECLVCLIQVRPSSTNAKDNKHQPVWFLHVLEFVSNYSVILSVRYVITREEAVKCWSW